MPNLYLVAAVGSILEFWIYLPPLSLFLQTLLILIELPSHYITILFCVCVICCLCFSSCHPSSVSLHPIAAMSVAKQIDNIVKPDGDKRVYRAIELTNGMKVMVVSDPTTEKAAAAMDVNIGRQHRLDINYTLVSSRERP